MFKNILKSLPQQFDWEPKIENESALALQESIIIAGMGGSNLAAGLLQIRLPNLPVTIHKSYGLPKIPSQILKKSLFIASSYSGNTEETLDAFNQALDQKLPAVIITSGGKLLELAKKNNIPYVQIPSTDIPPRFALGYSIMALLKLLGENEAFLEAASLAKHLDPSTAEQAGEKLAEKLRHKIPIIYASAANAPLAYAWKIKFNETTKIPTFCNTLPELNHNEMSGFDTKGSTLELMEKFHFVFLKDSADHTRILKRMDSLKHILEHQEFKVDVISTQGDSVFQKIFNSLLMADWASYHLAEFYGVDPLATPLVEEFKHLIA